MPVNIPIPFEKSNSKNNVINITPSITYEDIPISKEVLTALKTDVDQSMSTFYMPLNSMIRDGDIIYYIKPGFKYVKYDTTTDIKTELVINGYSQLSVDRTYIYKYIGDGKIYHMYTTGYASGGYNYILCIIDLKKLQYTKCFEKTIPFDITKINDISLRNYSLNRFLLDDEILFLSSTNSVYNLTKLSFTGVQTIICNFTPIIYSPTNITTVYKENGMYFALCTAQNTYQTPNKFRLYKCSSNPIMIKEITITVGTNYDEPHASFVSDFVVESPSRKKILLWPNPAFRLSPLEDALLYIEINDNSSDFTMQYIPTKLYGTRIITNEPVLIERSVDFTKEPNKMLDQMAVASLITRNGTTSYALDAFHVHPTFFDWNDPLTLYYIFGYRDISESGERESDEYCCYTKMQYKLPLMRKFISK